MRNIPVDEIKTNEHGVCWQVLYTKAKHNLDEMSALYRKAFRDIYRAAKKIDDAKLTAAVAAAKKALD